MSKAALVKKFSELMKKVFEDRKLEYEVKEHFLESIRQQIEHIDSVVMNGKQSNTFSQIYENLHNAIKHAIQNSHPTHSVPVAETDMERNPPIPTGDTSQDYGQFLDVGRGLNPYQFMHAGTFSKTFRNRKTHLRHLKTLKEFAHYIIRHPNEFRKPTIQRANFYKNLIERNHGGHLQHIHYHHYNPFSVNLGHFGVHY
jgi:hypothetical protein